MEQLIRSFAIKSGQLSVVILIFSCILFLLKYKSFPPKIKILGIYLTLNLFTELYSRYLFSQQIPNLFLLHIYTLAEFLFWFFFYKILFNKEKVFNQISSWFALVVSVLLVLNSIFWEPITGFNSNAKSLTQMIFIACAIYYFFNNFGITDFTVPINRSLGLVNFAVVFYYAGSIFIFMFSKYLADMGIESYRQQGFWAINACLNLIFQILIFLSLWTVAFKKTKS